MTTPKWSPIAGLETLTLYPYGLTTPEIGSIYGQDLRRHMAGLLGRNLVERSSDLIGARWTITEVGRAYLAKLTSPRAMATSAVKPTGRVTIAAPRTRRDFEPPVNCEHRGCGSPVAGAGTDYGLCEEHGRKERNQRLKASDEAYRARLEQIEAARAFTPSSLSVPPATVRRQWLIA